MARNINLHELRIIVFANLINSTCYPSKLASTVPLLLLLPPPLVLLLLLLLYRVLKRRLPSCSECEARPNAKCRNRSFQWIIKLSAAAEEEEAVVGGTLIPGSCEWCCRIISPESSSLPALHAHLLFMTFAGTKQTLEINFWIVTIIHIVMTMRVTLVVEAGGGEVTPRPRHPEVYDEQIGNYGLLI